MKALDCEFESEVLAAVLEGESPAELLATNE